MAMAEIVSRIAAELALFAGVGFLLFAVNDVLVDLIYFGRSIWRSLAVYTRYPRAFASELAASDEPGLIAVLVPAWDESSVIASMLRAALQRFEHSNYRIFVGYYANDPATAAAIASVADARIEPVEVAGDGPTTKADCLNQLYGIM
jgi:adsorption protein B